MKGVLYMNFFDDENRIIELFQMFHICKSCFLLQSSEAVSAFEVIHNPDEWKYWVNSSGHSDPPPDFYSDKHKLMMDVMRIDDHTRINAKGNVCNPVNQRESIIQKQLQKDLIPNYFPKAEYVFVNAVTDLPSLEDHNYKFYYTGFERVVKKHIDSIPLYRQNHPGYKVIFFILDESTGYVQVNSPDIVKRGFVRGLKIPITPYLHFIDKRFVDVFRGSDIDYVIWHTPYKIMDKSLPYELPATCVFDVKNYDYKDIIEYPEDLIMSTEE